LAFLKSYAKIPFMDPESKQLLQNTLALTEENNKLLHKIRGFQRRGTVWQVLKYLLIIGIALGAFYYMDPYLNKIVNLYNSVTGTAQNTKNTSSPSFLQDLLQKL